MLPMPSVASSSPKLTANSLLENIPVSMDITVIPTCMVERKQFGSFVSFSAAAAERLPCLACASSLLLRADINATSDNEKKALTAIRMAIITMSLIYVF